MEIILIYERESNMRKLIVLLLTLAICMSFAACGGGSTPEEGTDTADSPVAETANGLVTKLMTLEYESNVWILDEESVTDSEDYCCATLQIPDPEDSDSYMVNVDISVSITEPYNFREDLVNCGFDQYEYAENNAYDLVKVGGVDCIKYEGENWGKSTVKYFGRAEAENATVEVNIASEDISDSRIAKLLEGLKFTLTDIGHEDGPWEWEGEPYSAENTSVSANSFTVEANWLPIKDYISTFESFDHGVAAVGNTVYILTDGTLKQYSYDGTALNFECDIELPEDDYDVIWKTSDGTLWLSGSMNDLITLKDGKVTATYKDLDTVAVSPDGSRGVSYFTSNECQLLSFNGGSFTSSDIKFDEVDTLSYVRLDNDMIYICGYSADESGHKVFIYNYSGELQKVLCDAEGEALGSITYIAESTNGYIGFDGNMRDVILWDNEGAVIDVVEDSELFGTNYPWFCGSDMMDDSSIITVLTEDRADKSAMELVAYIVKVF